MNENVKKAFSSRLKELRTEKNTNQVQLAKDLKIGRASISNYEIGSRLPDADVVVALADYFNVSTDYLLGRTNMRMETIDSADKMINDLGKLTTALTRARKEDLNRMLSCIVEMLNNDFEEDTEYSSFSVYAGIMEVLLNFDKCVRLELSFLRNQKSIIHEINNVIYYYSMVDFVRDLAMEASEKITYSLRKDAVRSLTKQKELSLKWTHESHEKPEHDNLPVDEPQHEAISYGLRTKEVD